MALPALLRTATLEPNETTDFALLWPAKRTRQTKSYIMNKQVGVSTIV